MQDKALSHRPSDCGLAVTFPLSFLTFRADYRRPGQGRGFPRDYGRLAFPPGASAWEVWGGFAPVAREFRRVCRRGARLGVRVRTEATLADVRALFDACRVVTVFSHCPFLSFKPGELLDPVSIVQRLEDALRQDPCSAGASYRRAVALEWRAYVTRNSLLPERLGEDQLRAALCACWNALIERDERAVYTQPKGDEDQEGDTLPRPAAQSEVLDGPLVRFSRLDFEAAFPAAEVRALRCVDFADGPRSIRELAGLIPPQFNGVADLSICHSALIGEFLKGKGAGRRPCVVLLNRPVTEISSRLLIYKYTAELLAARDAWLDYTSAQLVVRNRILSSSPSRPSSPRSAMITTLRDVLSSHWQLTQKQVKRPYAGGKAEIQALNAEQAASLRNDLNKAIRQNKPMLWIIFSLIVVLLLVTIVSALASIGFSQGFDWISATSGGILAFLIPAAMKVWREITRLEMMVALATVVQGEALTALIRLLLEGTDAIVKEPAVPERSGAPG